MNIVKGIAKLGLTDAQARKLEAGAQLHRRHSNIEFKVLALDDAAVTIQAVQGKSAAGNHVDMKKLIELTKQLFAQFLPNHKIHVHATPYQESEISKIDNLWLERCMNEFNIRIKDIENDTGLRKDNISAWLNNLRPMSNIVKAMFYYYFSWKAGKQVKI